MYSRSQQRNNDEGPHGPDRDARSTGEWMCCDTSTFDTLLSMDEAWDVMDDEDLFIDLFDGLDGLQEVMEPMDDLDLSSIDDAWTLDSVALLPPLDPDDADDDLARADHIETRPDLIAVQTRVREICAPDALRGAAPGGLLASLAPDELERLDTFARDAAEVASTPSVGLLEARAAQRAEAPRDGLLNHAAAWDALPEAPSTRPRSRGLLGRTWGHPRRDEQAHPDGLLNHVAAWDALREEERPAAPASRGLLDRAPSRPAAKLDPEPSALQRTIDRGIDALLGRRYDEAYALFTEASGIDPEHHTVQANLTRLAKLGYGAEEGER